jgi:hypothetical protein
VLGKRVGVDGIGGVILIEGKVLDRRWSAAKVFPAEDSVAAGHDHTAHVRLSCGGEKEPGSHGVHTHCLVEGEHRASPRCHDLSISRLVSGTGDSGQVNNGVGVSDRFQAIFIAEQITLEMQLIPVAKFIFRWPTIKQLEFVIHLQFLDHVLP